jgi:hypothetical protein
LVAEPLVADGDPPSSVEFFSRWRERDEAIFEFIWTNRDLVRLVLAGGYSVTFADLMNAFAQRTYDVILESLNWGKEHRIYRREFHTHLVAVMIAGAYDRLARELVASDGACPNLRLWCAEAQTFVLRGIRDF